MKTYRIVWKDAYISPLILKDGKFMLEGSRLGLQFKSLKFLECFYKGKIKRIEKEVRR